MESINSVQLPLEYEYRDYCQCWWVPCSTWIKTENKVLDHIIIQKIIYQSFRLFIACFVSVHHYYFQILKFACCETLKSTRSWSSLCIFFNNISYKWEIYFLLFNRNNRYILYIRFAALLFTAALFTHIIWRKHNKAPITNQSWPVKIINTGLCPVSPRFESNLRRQITLFFFTFNLFKINTTNHMSIGTKFF